MATRVVVICVHMKFWLLLIRLNRWAGYALAVIVLLYLVSGYGMTRGLIDPGTATRLHQDILPLPLFAVLAIHLSSAIRTGLLRLRLNGNRAVSGIAFLSLAAVLAFFILFELGAL